MQGRVCEAAECRVCGLVFSCPEELSDHCLQAHQGRGRPLVIAHGASSETPSHPAAKSCPSVLAAAAATSLGQSYSTPWARSRQIPRSCAPASSGQPEQKQEQRCDHEGLHSSEPSAKVMSARLSGQQDWSCPGCGRSFRSQKDLTVHLSKPPRIRLSCSAAACVGCGRVCASAEQCNLHEEGCWRVLTCPGCDSRFGTAAAFQAHLKECSQHTRCSASQCGICGLVFGSPEERGDHERTHRGSRRRGHSFSHQQQSCSWHPARPAAQIPALADVPVSQPGTASAWESVVAPPPHPPQRAPEEIIRELSAEVARLEGADLRHRLRQLQLQWHPDRSWRYDVDAGSSCQIFGFIQNMWEERVLAWAAVAS